MLEKINFQQILFLDIETVPQAPNYHALPDSLKKLWDKKANTLIRHGERNSDDTPESLYPKAGIYAEFGKIICISAGYFTEKSFRVKSFYHENEKELLQSFCEILNSRFRLLCAHNGKEFDFPYISRRMLVNQVTIPNILNTPGKKPWEVNHLDTMELWKFGDHKNFTSLELLAHIFGIETPKDDIDGSQVYQVYYQEKNLPRIVQYCQKDVVTVAQLLLRFAGKPLIEPHQIHLIEN